MSAVTIFQKSEKIVNAKTALADAITFALPKGLTRRLVYLFLEGYGASNEIFTIRGKVVLSLGGVPVCELPAGIQNGASLVLEESLETCFLAGGSPVKDSLFVNFSNVIFAGAQTVAAVLQPLEVTASADKISFSIDGITNSSGTMTGWRAYLAVRSS